MVDLTEKEAWLHIRQEVIDTNGCRGLCVCAASLIGNRYRHIPLPNISDKMYEVILSKIEKHRPEGKHDSYFWPLSEKYMEHRIKVCDTELESLNGK